MSDQLPEPVAQPPVPETSPEIVETDVREFGPAKSAETHESFFQRLEAAVEEVVNPAHFMDWVRQEVAKFKA